jgi:hypothetical protein
VLPGSPHSKKLEPVRPRASKLISSGSTRKYCPVPFRKTPVSTRPILRKPLSYLGGSQHREDSSLPQLPPLINLPHHPLPRAPKNRTRLDRFRPQSMERLAPSGQPAPRARDHSPIPQLPGRTLKCLAVQNSNIPAHLDLMAHPPKPISHLYRCSAS